VDPLTQHTPWRPVLLIEFLVARLLVPQPPWAAFAVGTGALAVTQVVRARHAWACLRALHTTGRTG
jgi:hypothetical protein